MTARSIRMPQCAICRHPERARIEALRAGGASYRALAGRFGVHRDQVHRHWINHVALERRAALIVGPVKIEELAARAADESRSLIDYLAIARSVLFNQFLAAAEAGDRSGVANVGGRLLEILRELGRLTGELREVSGLTINNNHLTIIASPEFAQLQSGLLQIARNHPAARSEIIALLRDLDARPLAPKPTGPPSPLIDMGSSHAA